MTFCSLSVNVACSVRLMFNTITKLIKKTCLIQRLKNLNKYQIWLYLRRFKANLLPVLPIITVFREIYKLNYVFIYVMIMLRIRILRCMQVRQD